MGNTGNTVSLMNDTIIYEQPLNEVIRVCLRLEQLFHQIDHHLEDTSVVGTRNVITFIIHLLQIVDRPDLKAKLAKELTYHLASLMRFGETPEIDRDKLNQLTQQLDELARNFIDTSGKIGHRLRDIELLNMLRLQQGSPGGGCSFDMPLYHNWLQQTAERKQETIRDWLQDFAKIRSAASLVLDLVRKNSKVESKTALSGFHQELLDPNSNLRMIRIGVNKETSVYPETSIGRHFLSVRFFSPDIYKRPSQFEGNLDFWVAYCNVN